MGGMGPLIAGLTAGVLTLFDLDRVFYIPPKLDRRIPLLCWWWGFIIANGVVAGMAYGPLAGLQALAGMEPWARALVVGLGYRALISSKFATVKIRGEDIPFGPEMIYEKAKDFVFKRINGIATRARIAETDALVEANTLKELVAWANKVILHDALMSPRERQDAKEWILGVISDNKIDELEKRMHLAIFIRSGQKQ